MAYIVPPAKKNRNLHLMQKDIENNPALQFQLALDRFIEKNNDSRVTANAMTRMHLAIEKAKADKLIDDARAEELQTEVLNARTSNLNALEKTKADEARKEIYAKLNPSPQEAVAETMAQDISTPQTLNYTYVVTQIKEGNFIPRVEHIAGAITSLYADLKKQKEDMELDPQEALDVICSVNLSHDATAEHLRYQLITQHFSREGASTTRLVVPELSGKQSYGAKSKYTA